MAATFADLKLGALQRADMQLSPLVDDDELGRYVNAALKELQVLYCASFNDAYLTSASFTITSGNTAPLPDDFLKGRGLDLKYGAKYRPVPVFNFRERDRYHAGRRAHRIDAVIRIDPETNATGDYRLWYWHALPPLVDGTDTLDPILDRFADFIEITAGIACLTKEQTDTSQLVEAKNAVIARITAEASNRDSEPQQSEDVYAARDYNDPFPWIE